MTIRIGMIGYRNHAKRLINIIKNRNDCELALIYYPFKLLDIPCATNDIRDLYTCDAVVIASPNQTHFEYIMHLLNNFKGYIMCEKPPVNSIEDLEQLSAISESNKERVFFNYNFRFSYLNSLFTNHIFQEKVGEIIHINIISTHGLAFKTEYKNSWRANGNINLHAITETVAIHYIDLLNLHFGKVIKYFYTPTIVANTGTAFDTAHLSLEYKDKVTASIFVSYASPMINEILVIGTSGFCTIRDNLIKFFFPRDTFDTKGFFINPPLEMEHSINRSEDYECSLIKSFDFFIQHVHRKKKINTFYFDISLASNYFVLETRKT